MNAFENFGNQNYIKSFLCVTNLIQISFFVKCVVWVFVIAFYQNHCFHKDCVTVFLIYYAKLSY
jgi:hypothetical protein